MFEKIGLASIQKIDSITPHGNADSLEIAHVLGWEIIVKKGEFGAGDMCVFIQVDSVLPERPEFEFMRKYGFRIKTIRLRGVYSQGLLLPAKTLGDQKLLIGLDVSEMLGVTKYEKGTPGAPREKKGRIANFLAWAKWRLLGLLGRKPATGDFPTHIVAKTDETRIQSMPGILRDFMGCECYATIKHDGSSGTFIKNCNRLIVCSRNIVLNTIDNAWHEVAQRYGLANIPSGYVVQGEVIGPKIQGNPEELPFYELRVFNVFFKQQALSYDDMAAFCRMYSLPMADLYFRGAFHWQDVAAVMAEAGKARYRNGALAEGLVFRLCQPDGMRYASFKAVNPEYCLSHGE